MIGSALPNHCIPVPNTEDPDTVKCMLQRFAEGKDNFVVAKEIKIAVIASQNTPKGMCPNFTLAGLPQTVNESNTFGEYILDACLAAAETVGNVAILNQTTDGVSCEVQWNLTRTKSYLEGTSNHIYVPDPNHNLKNLWFQIQGGSLAASIVSYVADPSMLIMAGVAIELVCINDFDALVLCLASSDTIQRLLSFDFADVGNMAVTIMSLVFMRLRSCTVNSRELPWKHRALYSWVTFLWFSSFHTGGSTVMINKRYMLLELIGMLFLVTRKDISQPRRTTSKCNEHTFGMYRMMLRELNIEQLICIVNKCKITINAMFESNLVLSTRSMTGFKGYRQALPNFLESMKAESGYDKFSGLIDINVTMPVIDQLWETVKDVLDMSNQILLPFLKLFGVVDGNGLPPFTTNIDSPRELQDMIINFFQTTQKKK